MDYKVILETFEGPLDLLLHLIEKSKIDIYDIPISEITEQYIEYIKNMKELDLEITSEFLVMASTLLEIKSRMLLPTKSNKGKDSCQLEIEEADPRLELVKRLVEYKKYKSASKVLRKYEQIQKRVLCKPKEDISKYISYDFKMDKIRLEDLVKSLNKILENKIQDETLDINKIQRDEITLEECMKDLEIRLKEKGKIKFNKLFNRYSTKIEIIVAFLSILELIRLKKIIVRQEENFSDIIVIKNN